MMRFQDTDTKPTNLNLKNLETPQFVKSNAELKHKLEKIDDSSVDSLLNEFRRSIEDKLRE